MRNRLFGSGASRSRWAAVGAAVAVSLGAGGVAFINAAVNSSPAVFHALSPVRVFDTRVGTGGVPTAPIAANSTLDVVVAGVNGVPSNATAVVLNVTVVNGTASSFLTVWPSGDPRPLASSLNWASNLATPNAVTAPVGVGGRVSFYNLTGTVDVLADVTGYYTPAQTPPFTNVVAQTNNAPTLPATNGQIASVALTLPDVCPGPDLWSVMVSADGYFLTSGASGGVVSATVGLGLTPSDLTTGTLVNQNFNEGVQWREAYATSFIFTVDSGVQTFYEQGSTTHPIGVFAAQNTLYAQSIAVAC